MGGLLTRRAWLAAALGAAAGGARADGALVVVVHPKAELPTRAQVEDIFLGRGGPLLPVDLPLRSPAYARFYERLTGRDVAWVRGQWARAVFTGRGAPPRVLADADAVKRAVASDPGLVGYLPKDGVDGRVKIAFELA